jgi:hypothetical protein
MRAFFFSAVLIYFLGLFHCIQNKDDLFYSAAEANSKVFQAYTIKDITCGKAHVVSTVLIGRVKISDLEGCLRAIELTTCVAWQANDPTPNRCRSINYLR